MPELLRHVPRPLLTELSQGRWLPIVGAGFSKNAHVPGGELPPNWAELGRALADDVPELSYESPLDAISAYEQAFGRVALVDALGKLLRIHDAQPGAAHIAFAELGFEHVVTTNFDLLLERAYDSSGRPCLPLVEEFQLSARNPYPGPRLLKLHGDVSHPQRLVLTEDDYDRFLRVHPLLATSLGALLIDHTAILIGYSLDDPDMRQVLGLIKERLGRLARPVWAIQMNAPPHIISRYERRGVRVISLPVQHSRTFGDQLAELFRELRDYWRQELIGDSQSTDERALADLQLPPGNSRICYFAIPFELVSWYRDVLFPIVERHGFVPVAARDVLTPPGTVVAKIDTLISRAALVVVDVSGRNTHFEMILALRARSTGTLLLIAEEGVPLPADLEPLRVLRRPVDPSLFSELLADSFDTWFAQAAAREPERMLSEPERLLAMKEYKAAVIAAVALLESRLAQHFDTRNLRSSRATSPRELLRTATEAGLLQNDEEALLADAIRLRNAALHQGTSISQSQARSAVRAVQAVVGRIPPR